MSLSTVTFFFALFVIATVNAGLDEACTAVDGSDGDCIYLSKCDDLLQMVLTSIRAQISHDDAIAIIQKSTCGFIQSEPLVCCPRAKNDNGIDSDQKNSIKPVTPKLESSIQTTTVILPTASPDKKAPSQSQTIITNPTTKSGGEVAPTTTVRSQPTTTKSPSTKTPYVPTKSPPTERSKETEASTANASTTPVSNTTPVSDNTLDNEKIKLLPDVCGRVLSFKHFFGNRTEFDDFPWIALVEYDTGSGKQYACGGALISKRYVLTAASCVSGLNPTWKVSGVRFGEYDTRTEIDCLPDGPDNSTFCTEEPVDYAVEKPIVHPGFMPLDRSRLHDIALLRLARDVQFTDVVKPICLPFKQPSPQRFYTSGWGKNTVNKGTSLKYMSYLTLAKQDACAKQYKSEGISLSEFQVCAGAKSSEQACIGDQGTTMMGIEERSNLMKRVAAFGILSHTHKPEAACEKKDWPGVYTKVLDYVPWILSQLKE